MVKSPAIHSFRLPVTAVTYLHLLQGCVSDRQAGFRHALLVWRKMMLDKKWQRQRQSYTLELHNTLLRACLECCAGDGDFAHDIVLACMTVKEAREHSRLRLEANSEIRLEEQQQQQPKEEQIPGTDMALVQTLSASKNLMTVNSDDGALVAAMPNFLEARPKFDGVVSLSADALSKASNRLAVIGGPTGYLQVMKKNKVKPDAKTFSYLLKMVEPTKEAEASLIKLMAASGVSPDSMFFTDLIKRRSFRKDFKLGLGKSIMQILQENFP